MTPTDLPLAPPGTPSRPVFAVRPNGLETFCAGLPAPQAAYLRAAGFAARPNETVLLPGADGIAGAALGLGEDRSLFAFGGLSASLPSGGAWRIEPGDFDLHEATLGYLLGAYRYTPFRNQSDRPAQLALSSIQDRALSHARAIWMARDLINAPANRLGPAELADAAEALGRRCGAEITRTEGEALARSYPTVAAVGAGSERAPVVVELRWRGTGAAADAPLISLCGKGVCFDSGGYDIKPAAGMLRMKKDMGGAACALALAAMIMDADLPLRLSVRLGCVENSISGRAMRPMDVLTTRRGLTVEVGNTDAEGRLILCDLLAEASDEHPALLLDFATLTGAARVALGPDLPALFANDEQWASLLLQSASASNDPLWRMPLWPGYANWLDSPTADMNNVSSKPMAGSIIAALFLQRFVAAGVSWGHIDLYAWNDQTRPGRPEGGEAQAVRGVFAAVEGFVSRYIKNGTGR